MSQISSEYVIPEGAHNPKSQDNVEGLIAVSSEITDDSAVLESYNKELNIASARLEMDGKAIFGSQSEQISDPIIARIYSIARRINNARKEYLRAA